MAQDSAMHQGSTVGDAASTDIWAAPYHSDEFADIFSKLMASNLTSAFVLPGYGNDLKVAANSPAAMNVVVRSGAAFFRGRIYENTADATLTIATADATNPRIDRVVLQFSIAAQTIRLAIVQGTPAATPALPALTQNATTYELELGYVWVAAATASIADTEVHDTRQFMLNTEMMLVAMGQDNLIENSEFMASSLSGANVWADRWVRVSAPSLAVATKPAQMSRGQAMAITAQAGSEEGLSQTFPVKASTVYAIRALINVTAGDTGKLRVTTDSASPSTITRIIRRTGSYIEETIYYTTEADATTMTVSVLASVITDVVTLGQVLALEGYATGPFRQFHEIIMFEAQLTDTSWDTDAKSTGNTTISLTTSYSGKILAGTRAVYLRVKGNDSGSAAGSPQLTVYSPATGSSFGNITLSLQGLPNDSVGTTHGWVPVTGASRQMVFGVTATGASTFDADVRIYGIAT